MAKSSIQIKDLQRRLVRLMRLDGRLVVGADGAWLVWAEYVRAPRRIVQAQRAGDVPFAVLRDALKLQHEPLLLTARWLAAAQRDLRTLQKDPAVLAQTQAAARRFRGLPQPTPAWLTERQQRLDELASELHEPSTSTAAKWVQPAVKPTLAVPPWFVAVVGLVRTLRGPEAAVALQQLWVRSAGAPGPAQAARRRLLGLLDRLAAKPEPRPEEPALRTFLEEAAREAQLLLGPSSSSLRKRPLGRAQLRRLRRLVSRVVFWPAAPSADHGRELDNATLRALGTIKDGSALLTELAAPLLASLPKSRDPQQRTRLAQAMAHYGLLFHLDSSCPAINVLDLDWLDQQLDRATTQLAPYGLSLTQALALLKLPIPEARYGTAEKARDLGPLARHFAAGLPFDLLLRTCQLGYGSELRVFSGEIAALRAYCEWIVRLAPLYQQSGRTLELAPDMLTRFQALHDPSVAFLAHHLVSAAGEAAPPGQVEQQLTALDAAVGLCGRVPQRAAVLVGLLTTWPSGAGRTRFPAFASWLGDDALLDRYLHLSALAGEPAELSRTLLRDFAQAERLQREHDYLTALTTLDAKQQQRLIAVDKALTTGEIPSSDWTRRRLGERVTELLGRALRRQLDMVLREVLRQGFGVAPAVLTPAWRDAVRFYLATDRNGELLGVLLRFAATNPGRSPARLLEKNQRWLQRASEHMDVTAWLAPRRLELELEGQPFTLAIEDDPIEVLRMGIPFGTCLSLENGSNAAAAVLNAMDANKRVFYLRDHRGVIVGRKLVAVSADWGLLGYELYLSLDPRHKPAVAAAVLKLCEELARDTHLPLFGSGVPELLHEGFWYDDGPLPFAGPIALEVEAYCQELGLPVPTPQTPELTIEATQWQIRRSGTVTQALAALRIGRQCIGEHALGGWIVDQLGLLPAEHTARQQHSLRAYVLRRAANEGVQRQLQAAGSWPNCDAYEVQQSLRAAPPSALLATGIIEAAERARHRGERPDDHDLCHLTFTHLEPGLSVTPVAQLFLLCDRLQPLWSWFIEEQSYCQPCREFGIAAMQRAARLSYCRQPDPDGVITCLRSRRPGRLAQQVALHVAAAFPLTVAAQFDFSLSLTAEPLRAGATEGLRAVQTLGTRCPELVTEPDYLAALLRQAPRPVRFALPTPNRAPFEELADLLLDPTTRALLAGPVAHTVSGPAELTDYQPGAWELYYHRRQETPLRKRLTRAVQALGREDAGDNAAEKTYQKHLALLADLGEVDTLTELAARFDRRARGRQVRAALDRATTVAGQVAMDSLPEDTSLCTLGSSRKEDSQQTPSRPQLRDVPEILDRGLAERVLRKIKLGLDHAAPVDAEYVWALYALTTAALPRAETEQILCRLLQARRGALDTVELWYLNWLLQKATWELPEISLEQAVALWQHPELRDSLAAALANGSQWPLRYHQLQQLATRAELRLDGLLEKWLPLHIERDVDTALSAVNTAGELELLLDAAFVHLPPSQWLAIYQSLYGYAEAACFLDRLRTLPLDPKKREQFKQLVDGASWHYPDDKARGSWLAAVLTERHSV